MTTPHGNKNNKRDDDKDKRFKDAYCKALAQALLDKEEEESKSKSPQVTIANAYKELCFDFPTAPPFECTSNLALILYHNHFAYSTCKATASIFKNNGIDKILSKEGQPDRSNTLALSNRFVQGVIDTCSTAAASTAAVDTHNINSNTNNMNNSIGMQQQQQQNDDDGDLSKYIMSGTADSSLQHQQQSSNQHRKQQYSDIQGCNLLSFVLFALGPLACIQTLQELQSKSTSNKKQLNQVQRMQKMNSIQSFLGSYQSSLTTFTSNTTATSESNHENNCENQLDDLLSSMNEMKIASTNTIKADDASSFSKNNKMNDNQHDQSQEDHHLENINDHDSLDEVWAEESDPDDYEYGDERYQHYPPTTSLNSSNNNHEEKEGEFAYLDPFVLSKKQTLHRSMINIVQSIQSLINELSFAKLLSLKESPSALSSGALWEEWNVTQVLYDLTFILLQFSNQHHEPSIAMEQNDKEENDISLLISKHLSYLYTKPLMVLRDCALNERYENSTSTNSSIDDYVKILQTLLDSDETIVGEYASKNQYITGSYRAQPQLSPSKIIGFSSFSALCTVVGEYSSEQKLTKRALYHKIHKVLLDKVDVFTDCIEFVRPKANSIQIKNKNTSIGDGLADDPTSTASIPSWIRVTMSLLPILDFLTGINSRSDFSAVIDAKTTSQQFAQCQPCGLKNADAQSILQSGLFRELLMLYSTTSNASSSEMNHSTPTTRTDDDDYKKLDSARNVIRLKLLRAILIMSSQASSTLGKYASRVPDLTQMLYSEKFMRHHLVDSILWFALLYHMNSSNVSNTSQMRIKGSVTLAANEIRDLCVEGSIRLCSNLIDVLEDTTKDIKYDFGYSDEFLLAVQDFTSLSNSLFHTSCLAKFWVETISIEKDLVKESLNKLLKSLILFQKKQIGMNQTTDDRIGGEEKSKKHVDKSKLQTSSSFSSYSVYCDKIRSSTKFLILILESLVEPTKNGGSKGDAIFRAMSSKND